jgi:hypothetical protein
MMKSFARLVMKRSDTSIGMMIMTDRKNIKIDAEMYERLRDEKGGYETWNALFDRLLSEVEDDDA